MAAMIDLNLGPGYLPAFIVEEVLPSAPVAGGGVHRFLFDLARLLAPYRTPDVINRILHNFAASCGRHVPESEINSAIRAGQRYAWRGSAASSSHEWAHDANCASNPSPRAPEPHFDPAAFSKFIAGHDNVDAQCFAARSPIAPWNRTPASLLHALYRKGEKVVVFEDYHSQGQALWVHPGLPYDARNLNQFATGKRLGVWFLCNPVDGELHVNDEGKLSRRSHQNVTSWRYMVVESDRGDITASGWLAAIAQLPLPVAAIYETGGRLPHALLRVDASSKEDWDHVRDCLAPLLTMLGADLSSLSAVRLTRLPCCQRLGKEDAHGTYQKFPDGPHLQRLLYLNPAPNGTPITQQHV